MSSSLPSAFTHINRWSSLCLIRHTFNPCSCAAVVSGPAGLFWMGNEKYKKNTEETVWRTVKKMGDTPHTHTHTRLQLHASLLQNILPSAPLWGEKGSPFMLKRGLRNFYSFSYSHLIWSFFLSLHVSYFLCLSNWTDWPEVSRQKAGWGYIQVEIPGNQY